MDASRKNDHSTAVMVKSILMAQLFAAGVGLMLLLVFCAIACRMDDPDSVTMPLALCALYLSGLAGGIAAVRLSGDGILSGLLSGGLTMLLFRLISLLPLYASGMTPTQVGIYCALIPVSSACGAVIGKSRKSARAKHRMLRR